MRDIPDPDAEFRLLCLVVHPRPDLDAVGASQRAGIDYGRLLRLAQHHGVRPSLLHSLAELQWNGVPAEIRMSLEQFRREHLLHALILVSELRLLCDAFAGANLRFITFKGPALALALYGDLAQREYNDIDIMVPPERVGDAERILERLGYGNRQGDERFRRVFLSRQGQYAFTCAARSGAIDLHWNFAGASLPFPLSVAELWRHPHWLAIADRDVLTIDNTELALLLAGHGTKEGWIYLKWLRDFACLIERRPDLDWADIHRRAVSARCGDTVLLGCALANEVLGVAPPAALRATIEASARTRRLLPAVTGRLHRSVPDESEGHHLSDLSLCDRPLDRAKAFLSLALTPTAGDHAMLNLPSPWWPLYYLIRPFRLAVKAMRRAMLD